MASPQINYGLETRQSLYLQRNI